MYQYGLRPQYVPSVLKKDNISEFADKEDGEDEEDKDLLPLSFTASHG